MRWFKRKDLENGYVVENVGIVQSSVDAGVGRVVHPPARVGEIELWTRNNRVRDFSRRFGGHSHFGDHDVPSEAAGTLERHRRWHKRLVARLHAGRGQATVEFAIVMAGFLALIVALGAFWRMLGDGLIIEHALASASHHIQSAAPTTAFDIFLY